jgi:hypothetical protein
MPVSVRRFLYGLLTLLGVVMMVPLSINATRMQTALEGIDPMSMALDPELSAWIGGLWLLFVAGACIAAGFLYLAVSTGYPKGWRPIENGQPCCARCGAAVDMGLVRCTACDQRLAW